MRPHLNTFHLFRRLSGRVHWLPLWRCLRSALQSEPTIDIVRVELQFSCRNGFLRVQTPHPRHLPCNLPTLYQLLSSMHRPGREETISIRKLKFLSDFLTIPLVLHEHNRRTGEFMERHLQISNSRRVRAPRHGLRRSNRGAELSTHWYWRVRSGRHHIL